MKKLIYLLFCFLTYQSAMAQILHNNGVAAGGSGIGGIVTPGIPGAGGAPASVLNGSNTSLGAGHQITGDNSVADDFTASSSVVLDSLLFFAYQTGSTTTSTINDLRVRIWSGAPNAGGTIVYGDTITNRLTSTSWSGVYRVASGTPTDATRPIMNVKMRFATPLNLPPGTYWIEWNCGGTLTSGPWAPVLNHQAGLALGNALQAVASAWQPLMDAGSSTQMGLPFIVYGRLACTPIATMSSVNATCSASNGSATVTASAGDAPYTYLWSTGATTATINNLAPGNYMVTVTGNTGCPTTASTSVGSSVTTLTATNNTNPSSCAAATGSATVTPTNGTGPYTYLWNNGQTDQTAINLAANSYTVSITDANGCRGTISGIVVGNPNPPTATINTTAALCSGGSSGSATVNPSAGTAPYTQIWSNGATTATISGLSAGTYMVTVTDNNSCSVSASASVAQPPVMNASTNTTLTMNVSCKSGSNGVAAVNTTGGTFPYSYMWSNAGTSNSINALTAGIYMVTVMDANSCTVTHTISITEPAVSLNASATGTSIACNGAANGTAVASGTGGTGAYTYLWSNAATTANVNALIPGVYMATITDANNCVAVSNAVTVTEPTAIAQTATATGTSSAGGSDGSVALSVSGGTAPYTYLWSNGASTQNIAALVAGTYSVTVTDANGCSNSASYVVSNGPTAVENISEPIQLELFPNPATNSAILKIQLEASSDISIQVIDITGRVISNFVDLNIQHNQYQLDLTNWTTGLYFVKVSTLKKSVTIKLTKI